MAANTTEIGHDEDDTSPIEDGELNAAVRQYEVYVTMTEAVFDRRSRAHQFYLSLNTALIGGLTTIGGGLGLAADTLDGFAFSDLFVVFGVFGLIGFAICFNWYRVLWAYSKVLGGKYPQIHAMERRLPCRPFLGEWNAKPHEKWRVGPGIATAERRLPLTFMWGYAAGSALAFLAYWRQPLLDAVGGVLG